MRATILITAAVLAPAVNAQEWELTANDADRRDTFGASVDIDGSTVLVGASRNDQRGADSGSVYAFVMEGGVWSQQQRLLAPDADDGDRMGGAVSLSGDTALLGAHGDDHVDDTDTDQGSAYVFVRIGGSWSQQAKLTASDAAALDFFGLSVAVDANTAVIGAPYDDDMGADSGSVYVFTRSGVIWTQEAKLTASDGESGDLFGHSIAVHGDTAVVGALRDDDGGFDAGAVYVYVRAGTTWSFQAKLTASDASASDAFSQSVAIHADTLAVGAARDDDPGLDSGSAYVFERTGTAWSESAKLTPVLGGALDGFGHSVDLTPERLAVGALGDNEAGASSGAAYVFARRGAGWRQFGRYVPSETAAGDFFGSSVAASGYKVVVGSGWDDDDGINSGSAHVFRGVPGGPGQRITTLPGMRPQ